MRVVVFVLPVDGGLEDGQGWNRLAFVRWHFLKRILYIALYSLERAT